MQNALHELIDQATHYAVQHKLTFCTAESCSAGALASAFAKGQDAATCLTGGIVAYTKEGKTNLLGVSAKLLEEKGAVCAEVAEEMALGAVRRSRASFGLSITGVAGPTEDEDGNPVGLIYCGVASSTGLTKHIRLELPSKDPEANVKAACVAAVDLLLRFCTGDSMTRVL
jgi:PncC family amidohydrolase